MGRKAALIAALARRAPGFEAVVPRWQEPADRRLCVRMRPSEWAAAHPEGLSFLDVYSLPTIGKARSLHGP
jgi:hypothetical protein